MMQGQCGVDILPGSATGPSAAAREPTSAQWFRTAMNQNVSTGSLAHPFARTAHSFACFALLAAHSLSHSRARRKVDDWMSHNDLSLSHSVLGARKIAFRLINRRRTMVQKNQESSYKYQATRSSVCWFACTIHSFACSTLLALLTHSAALIHLLACSLTHSQENG